jgi:hypothetical protein
MIRNDWIDLWRRFTFNLDDPHILAEAHEILIHGARGERSDDVRLEDSKRGLAVQYAVADHLFKQGNAVCRPEDGVYHYDLIVNGYFVDVKCRFTGKFWQQTKYEAKKVPESGDRVLYLCIDAFPETRPEDQRFKYMGGCWSENLSPSDYGCPYVDQKNFIDLDELMVI